MARGVSAAERTEAVTIIPAGADIPLDDVEQAYEDWRSSFEHSTEPGKIRAFQIPLDERGQVNLTAKNQVRLGSWAIDLYDYDDLCGMIIRDFMLPNGEKIMAVRFIGTKTGERGVVFNKIVLLRAPQGTNTNQEARPNKESMTEVLSALQAMQSRNLELMQRLAQPAERPDPLAEMQRTATFMQSLNAPFMAMLTALIPALVGRPAAAAPDSMGQLSGLIDVVGKVKDLTAGGENDGGGGGESDLVQILKAVVPVVKPGLEVAAEAMRRTAPPRRVIEGSATPTPNGTKPTPRPPAGPAPGSQPTQPPPAQPQAAAAQLTDLPSGDASMFAELKPQVDTLVTMAQQGSPADGAADLLYDQYIAVIEDDAAYDKICDIIEGQNFVRNAAVLSPAVMQYQAWFDAFRAQLLKRIKDADAEAGLQPTPG